MSKRKETQSWKKLMRQREQERNRFGGAGQAFSGIVHFEDDDFDFDEDDDFDFDEDDDEDDDENNHEDEYLWSESIRNSVA